MSDNFLNIIDFTLSPFTPKDDGLSGALLLATSKTTPSIQYILKSEMPHLACNEFMYNEIASAIGLHTKEVKLLSPTKKFPKAVGIRYTSNLKSPKDILSSNKSLLSNFLEFETLRVILEDDDTPEYYLDDEGRLFSLDHSEAFNLDEFNINAANMPEEMGLHIFANAANYTMSTSSYPGILEFSKKRNGQEGIQSCLSVFQRFAALDIDVLDEALDALDEVYPEIVSKFFYEFVSKRQELCAQFLKDIAPAYSI